MATLKNIDLMEEYTDALIHDDNTAEHIHKNSKYAKELFQKGKEVIPEIGKYLHKLKQSLKECNTQEQDTATHGWIILLCEFATRDNVNTGILDHDLDKWIEWSVNFKT